MPELQFVTLDMVDIALDPVLVARYGASIPVVAVESGAQLAWPFNADDVLALMS